MPLLLALLADPAAAASPSTTVAVTLSGLSLVSVGTLLFKAGEWRGEHRALATKVTDGYTQLQKQIDDAFDELRADIRELRETR